MPVEAALPAFSAFSRRPQTLPSLPIADSSDFIDFVSLLSDEKIITSGACKISIDEINRRQDQILLELDQLDQRINDLIELWTTTEENQSQDLTDYESQIEQAA